MCKWTWLVVVPLTAGALAMSAHAAQRKPGNSAADNCSEVLQECLRGCKTNDGACITWCQEFIYANCKGGSAAGAPKGAVLDALGAGKAGTLQIAPSQ
jgi:hypothetical protein